MTLQLFFKTAVRTFNSLLYLVARFVIFTELDIKWFREHRFHKRALWIAAHVIISLKQLNVFVKIILLRVFELNNIKY